MTTASALRALTVDQVIAVTAEAFDLTPRDLRSARRSAELVAARFAAAWLARRHTEASYPLIGRRMGGRDHQSIIHAERRAAEWLTGDESFAARVAAAEIAIAALTRLNLISALDGVDVVALARRVDAAPARAATSVSTVEIAAMAAWIVERSGPAPTETSPTETSPTDTTEIATREETTDAA
jgi:chromosomal replication initiator protein